MSNRLKVTSVTRVIIEVNANQLGPQAEIKFHRDYFKFLLDNEIDSRTMRSGDGLYIEDVLPEQSTQVIRWLEEWKSI